MNKSANFSTPFTLLQQEGHLIRSCLATGLTKLRNANVHNKGEFYAALFNLSVGTERLLKACLIMNHMTENNLSVPTKRQLKAFGHDLIALYNSCVEASERGKCRLPALSSLDPITHEILGLLSDFAQTTRYHNLDALSSSTAGKDPLHQFDEILRMTLAVDVSPKVVQQIVTSGSRLAADISEVSMIISQSLTGSDLTLEQGLTLPALHAKAIPHVVFRLIQFLARLRDFIETLSMRAYGHGPYPPFPQMHEFVDFLWEDDRAAALRKKKWP